jgi:hypothetical protein
LHIANTTDLNGFGRRQKHGDFLQAIACRVHTQYLERIMRFTVLYTLNNFRHRIFFSNGWHV